MHKEIIIIVAYAANNRAIGRNGGLPWKNIPTDMKRFAEETSGHTVIMGRDTYWSIPEKYRPLSERQNIVVTTTQTQKDFPDSVIVCTSLDEALKKSSHQKIFLIGGTGIYQEAMNRGLANTILATIVYLELEPCDRFFPEMGNEWQNIAQEQKGLDEKTGIPIRFVTFMNRKNPAMNLQQI
jgi:dihydrofolate reductase